MSTFLKVDIRRIDERIRKAEEELVTLKKARELIQESQISAELPLSADRPKGEREDQDGHWYADVPKILADGPASIKALCQKLKERRGGPMSYPTVYAWMKRAVARGEYVKKGKKYRIKEDSMRGG